MSIPSNDVIFKTAKTYAVDLAERVIWTFLIAAGGVALASDPADMFHASFWETVGTAGLVAVGSLVKGVIAKFRGDPNSASLAKDV
jgi:hypothetical protein